MAIDTVRIKDLEEVSVNDLDQLWMVVDSGTPDSTNKVKLSALAGYIGGQADGRYIPLAGSSDITGSLIPKADKAIALGSGSFRWSALHAGEVHAADVLSIPSSAPSDPVSGNVYLYASSLGEYSGTPGGGGGSATIYDLIYQKNGTTVSTINLGTAQGTINVTISRSDVEDSTHKLATTDQISAWNAKLDSVPLATSSVIGGFKYGDPEDTMLVLNDGYLALDLLQFVSATQTIVEGYGYTPKNQAIPYIVGPSTDTTAGNWTGTYDGITAYSEGLTIIYVPNVAGASTTKLNINGLGAVTCYYSGTSKMTTHYPVGTPILLTYRTISGTAGWRRADYDSNTNTYIRIYRQTTGYDGDYPIIVSRTQTIGTAGSNGSYTAVYGVVGDTNIPTINPMTGLLKATTFQGNLAWSYITDKPTLGTAAALDSVTSITSGGANLPTAGTVYTYVNNAITSAQPYKGVSSTAITDGGTEMPTISGYTTRTKGDVVAYNNKEFIWEGDKWRELGDEGSYALKTVQVIAGTGLTGGGAISQDVTLSFDSSTLNGYVNEIEQDATGNYVTSISKSGKKLTITRATLPTTIALSNVTGAEDLQAIEALTGTSGLLKKTAANTWSLDTNTYLTASSHAALTLKVGTITIGSDFNSLSAKTYTISKQNLTDTIGSTTYAAYNADGYLPLSAGSGKALTGTLYGTSAIFSGDITAGGAVQVDTTIHADGNISSDLNVLAYGVKASDILAIPTSAPSSAAIVSGEVYLYASSLGSYSETPGGGGGSATIYDLIYQKNGTTVSTINLGTAQGTINVTISRSDVEDTTHKLATTTQIANWNTAYGWGDHAQAGYLTSFTETDPVFSASASAQITAEDVSNWDDAYGWGDHAQAGYLTSVAFSDLTAHPTTLSGYGITDAKIENGVITLGGNTITPLTSFTETDPTVPSWAKASSKPTYSLTEITGTDDLQAIEALSGTSGFLKKTAANTWSLDTSTYLTSVAFGDLTSHPTTLSGYGITDAISAVTSTDNAVTRFNGTGGAVQNSVVTIDDDGNLFLPVATSTTFRLNAKLVIGNAWFGSNPTGGLCYGTRSGDTFSGYYTFESNQFRPVSSSDNAINIGTTSYRWKNLYLAGTIGNGTYALTLPSKSGTIAVTGDLNSYLPLAGGTLTGDLTMSSGTTIDTAAAKLAIPTAAPASPTSGKIYLYASSTGSYAVEPWYGFNQIIQNGCFDTTSGWVSAYTGSTRSVSDGVCTLTVTSETYRAMLYKSSIAFVTNHTYYFCYTMKITTSNPKAIRTGFIYSPSQQLFSVNSNDSTFADWHKMSGTIKVNSTQDKVYLGRVAQSTSNKLAVGDTVQIKNVMFCDLTEMFGDDNLPTVAQFEAMYPHDYYDYTPIGGE